jgi:hypothetical protein
MVIRAPVIGVAFTAILLLGSPPPTLAQKPRAELPVYTLGEKWLRSDGDFDLIRIEQDAYIFSAGNGREIHLTKDLAPKLVKRAQQVVEFDPPPKFVWPLEVGKWGVSDGTWRTPDYTRGESARFAWSVDAYEEVRVPAGTFKAFRIALSVTPNSQHTLSSLQGWTGKLWYAPEAHQYVKAAGRFEIELSDFQVVSLDHPPATSPFQLTLQQPKDQDHVVGESVLVAGKVTAARGVTRVIITLNGKEVAKQEEQRAPKTEIDLSIPIKLREGINVLHVAAIDASGDTRQEARTVYYDRSPPSPGSAPPVPSPPPAQAAAPLLLVKLLSPQDQARVDSETIAVAGVASGGAGISQVVVALNGIEVGRLGGPAPQPALGINLPVKLAEGVNTLVLTATDASGAIRQEVRTIHFEPRVPLTVTVRYPEDRARLPEAQTLVAAQVTSSRGVTKVTVTLNGTQVFQQSERSPQRSVLVTAPVTLREGANVIGVSAIDPDGTVRQEVRTVIYDRAPGVATTTPPKGPPPKNRWAVVIGIGHYDRPTIPGLQYPVADADSFYQVLIEKANFKKENVLLLTDKTEKRPTLRNIKWALGTFLARSAQRDDLVIIYYAGHGAPEVDPRGTEPDGLAKYLIPSDTDPDDLYSTALPMDEVQTIFGRIEAEQVVVFLDACYSGAAGGRTFASKRTRASKVDDVFLDRITRSNGRVIVTASRASEVSIELPELSHGIFTYYLVQGLRGAADLDRDGIVSLQELYQYLEQEVSRKSRSVGGNQHPVIKGEMEGPLPLATVGAR